MSKLRSAYNVYDAKNSLSELIERAEAGEEIVLMKRGKPVARLVPLKKKKKSKVKLGWAKDILVLNPGWDEPLTDFEGY